MQGIYTFPIVLSHLGPYLLLAANSVFEQQLSVPLFLSLQLQEVDKGRSWYVKLNPYVQFTAYVLLTSSASLDSIMVAKTLRNKVCFMQEISLFLYIYIYVTF